MNDIRRWLVMVCLCLSGGIIYLLPYLREVYYLPLLDALNLSNTQLGVMMSVFGATAMISYFPGGWIADRISPKILISLSMIATGLAGFFFATFPSYKICLVIHAFWGISVTLTFWAALIKATRNWAPPSQQGRAFGILEGGRGIAELVSSTALLALFAKLGSQAMGLSWVIVVFSVCDILIGISAWFLLDDKKEYNRVKKRTNTGITDIIRVLKMPPVWLLSIVIMAAYSAYWGSYYFTPYATDVFKMSLVFGGAIGVGKMWVKPIPALGAGFLADKIGPSCTVAWSFVVLIFSFCVFVFTPGSPDLVLILIINTAIASLAIFAVRGVYYAMLEEGGIPLALTGTATGIVSVIGYTPDIFMPVAGGALLDKYPGAQGYRFFFLIIIGLSVLGLVSALVVMRKYSRFVRLSSKNQKTLEEGYNGSNKTG
jgi:nitrate/nitrite transporter NarK